jgi:peptide chain release factor 3
VFKVQAGMDTNHRDRVAFARVTSGVFERGMVVTHAQSGRPFATKYAQAMFGRERTVLDEAYPGDIIGLVNATSLRPGDTLFLDPKVEFPPIATFAPEHFAVATSADTGRFKQFRKGIDQLDSEGVVQVLRSDLRGNQSPVLAAVGPMQFEVAQARMESEFGAPIRLEHLGVHAGPSYRRRVRGRARRDPQHRGAQPQRRHLAGARAGQVADQHGRARSPRPDPRAAARR